MTIQGLILAAGRGSRMKEATGDKPKCLVPLVGKPLFKWQLDALLQAGVDPITVARGYKAEMLQGSFNTVDNPRWSETNMVSSLLCALPQLEDAPCIVSYSDIVYHYEHVRALVQCEADIAMVYDTDWRKLWQVRFENPLEDAETFEAAHGFLKEIGCRTDSYEKIHGQFMGLLRFTPAGFKTVREYLKTLPESEVDALDMTALLHRLLMEGISIATVPVSGGWCEADSMHDVACYENLIAESETNKQRWSHDWRW